MRRSSVVFPEPEGPSSATSSPEAMSSDTRSRAANLSKSLLTSRIRTSILEAPKSMAAAGCDELIAVAPFEQRLEDKGDQRKKRKKRGDRESGDPVVLIVEDLDVERHGVGDAADVAGDDRDPAELAHRPGIAEKHAIHQPPLHIGQRYPKERMPAAGAERDRRFLVLRALFLHQRDQFPGNEGKRHEDRREHD